MDVLSPRSLRVASDMMMVGLYETVVGLIE